MRPETARRLTELNRAFYQEHAGSFGATRSSRGREVFWIIPWIPQGSRVLDLGCGNGRTALLMHAEGLAVSYVGVDGSTALIRLARECTRDLPLKPAFFEGDILGDELSVLLGAEGRHPPFDVVLLLAVLHHVPEEHERVRLLRRASSLVSTGRILVSTWQFLDNPRMRRKIVPWSILGIDESELGTHDALLSWKGGEGYRYCHHIDAEELALLAHEAGLEVVSTGFAGGREGTLSLCAVLRRASREPLGASPGDLNAPDPTRGGMEHRGADAQGQPPQGEGPDAVCDRA